MKLSNSLNETLWNLRHECPCIALLMRGLNDSNHRKSLLLNPDSIGDYFSFRESEGLISYMPVGRTQTFTADGKWERKGRQEIKPAKWLRAILSPKLLKRFKDSDIAAFAEKFKAAEQAGKISFEFVSFEEGYNGANYSSDGSIHSCMWDSPVGDFYRHFGARCLVAKEASGRYRGRAVVWKIEANEMLFVDRIYADSPEITELFFQHAKENNMMRKTRQSTGTAEQVTMPDGETKRLDMMVKKQTLGEIGFWPYCDTFQHLCASEVMLSNAESEDGFVLNDTCGGRGELNNHEGEVEDVDGVWISEDDAVCVGDDYYSTEDDRIVYCERSEEYILTSESYTIETGRNTTITVHERFVTQN